MAAMNSEATPGSNSSSGSRQQQQQQQQQSDPFRIFSLEEYLMETIQCVVEQTSTYTVTLNDGHRKSMMRALMGVTKVDFDQMLRTFESEKMWNKSQEFVKQHLSLVDGRRPPFPSVEAAPQFQEGLENKNILDDFQAKQQHPSKFFSYLARGRTYQGKFQRLLQDVQPELVSTYQDIFRKLPEKELLECFVLHSSCNKDDDPSLQQELLQCIHYDFPQAPPNPADGGKSSGIKGETDLLAYLQKRLQEDQSSTITNTQNDDNCPDSKQRIDTKKTMILAPVWIKAKSNKSISDKCAYVIQLPRSMDLNGMTTELDAVIVEQDSIIGGGVRLDEVWEAKATLHPMTFEDVLKKKSETIAAIVKEQSNNDSQVIIDGQRFGIVKNDGDDEYPKLGIFGSNLLSPPAAARRVQLVWADFMLETDASVVREALQTGHVQPSKDAVVSKLESILRLARILKPKVVISSSGVFD